MDKEHMRIHLKCLSKSKCAKDCEDLTVIPLGFAVEIVKEEISKIRKTDKETEDYLFNIVKKTIQWLSIEEITETTTNEEIADFVMLELFDLK